MAIAHSTCCLSYINSLSFLSVIGFCDAEDMFQSSDNRGSFVWNETEVGEIAMSSCFYGSLVKGGFATRQCLQHQTWGPYNGSLCCTKDSSGLCNLVCIIYK